MIAPIFGHPDWKAFTAKMTAEIKASGTEMDDPPHIPQAHPGMLHKIISNLGSPPNDLILGAMKSDAAQIAGGLCQLLFAVHVFAQQSGYDMDIIAQAWMDEMDSQEWLGSDKAGTPEAKEQDRKMQEAMIRAVTKSMDDNYDPKRN